LSFAIADGIIPSNEGRGYVLRRILRRAVRYGRSLGFHEPFFFKMVDVVAKTMGDVFAEVRAKEKTIKNVIRREEEAFNKTLDVGLKVFDSLAAAKVAASLLPPGTGIVKAVGADIEFLETLDLSDWVSVTSAAKQKKSDWSVSQVKSISGEDAFKLYDTYGFPLDLTELIARERGLTVDVAGFEKLMEEQRDRARKAQKKDSIEISNIQPLWAPTRFVGYDNLSSDAVGNFILDNNRLYVEISPFYAEMGGQVGDTGWVESTTGARTDVVDTRRTAGGVHVLRVADPEIFGPRDSIPSRFIVDKDRRHAIERHHTATHLLHWALQEVVSRDASQKGSYVGPDKLTFDFSSAPLTKQQVREVEKLVNEKIAENAPVSWTEIPFAEAKQRKDIIQFFGEKYGDTVRVLQIGGAPRALNGYSMELCGGTHVRSTAEIGPFRIVREEAIAAGTRRIEAVAGDAARAWANEEAARQQERFEALARRKPDIAALPAFVGEGETAEMLKQIDARAALLEKVDADVREWEKKTTKAAEAELRSRAAQMANQLVASHTGKNFCVAEVPDADAKLLQAVADALKSRFNDPIFLVSAKGGNVALIAAVPEELTSKFQANKLIQQIAPIVGGKGGGRADSAQGAGKDPSKLAEALARARQLLS
jgi:alanyl-tRNA synthetase